jgi:hypothetical protein
LGYSTFAATLHLNPQSETQNAFASLHQGGLALASRHIGGGCLADIFAGLSASRRLRS